jgi:hypothetical protein
MQGDNSAKPGLIVFHGKKILLLVEKKMVK